MRVLWIDDEVQPDDALVRLLAVESILVELAATGADGLRKALTHAYDVIVLDLRLPDMFGMTVLRRLIASDVATPVIVSSGWCLEPEVDEDACGLGAVVLHKPLVDIEELVSTLRSLAQGARTVDRIVTDPPHGIAGDSAATRATIRWVERVASSKVSVLLTGETGTGKEVVALAIHGASTRRDRPFVPVNCGAIPDALFESELFGHRKGAFTGADEEKAGLIETAAGGTLFLDEIGEMPMLQQVRLLRFLDSGEVRRVGETRSHTVDVRVIAATNRSIREEVSRGRFREDLYYRLAAVSYSLSALRERPEDIEAVSRYWLRRFAQQDGRRPVTLSHDALDLLRAQRWPGNARELRNVLEHAWSIVEGPVLTQRDVLAALGGANSQGAGASSDAADRQRRAQAAWAAHRWNATQAAKSLGIDRTTFYRWLRPRRQRGDA